VGIGSITQQSQNINAAFIPAFSGATSRLIDPSFNQKDRNPWQKTIFHGLYSFG
jgi:hypothetical protein